jgi:hypothetical protein
VLAHEGKVFEIVQNTEVAIFFALGCLLAVELGFQLLTSRVARIQFDRHEWSNTRLALLYVPPWALSFLVGPLTFGGLAQPLIVITWLRFIPLSMMLFQWLARRRGGRLLSTILCVEVVSGFLGYFSTFNNMFFVLGTTILAVGWQLERRTLNFILVGFCGALFLGAFWTAIKPAYRAELNLGKHTQSVNISVGDRLNLLTGMAGNIRADDLEEGLIGLALRISYVDYLPYVLSYVPAEVPHTNGQLWGEAISNVVTPRLFFPEKASLASDSERTMRYTGILLASGSEGTSISMGYVAESYVDFGLIGALLVCTLMGMAYGFMARIVVRQHKQLDIFVITTLAIVLFPAQLFETSNVKLLGGAIWNFVTCLAFIQLIWPKMVSFFKVQRQVPHRNSPPTPMSDDLPAQTSNAVIATHLGGMP